MKTPIFDFVKSYADSKTARFHMPGHKGVLGLGCEAFDITEIKGADVLYSADGIIMESENNLSSLYGTAHSFYSTEGSTLAIKAMLRLATERAGEKRPTVLAARNIHTAFIKAAALLDLDVEFMYPEENGHLCKCIITPQMLSKKLESLKKLPAAVYVTSPDYLGNVQDIRALASVCRDFGLPLLVDNAHGAYLKFLPEDLHPITLGAAMCADSAHKTLPVLTGGAYLHVSKDYPEYAERAREALSLFASTSPSYLTLCSLDLCNSRLDGDFSEKIKALTEKIFEVKEQINRLGLVVKESETLKIVIFAGESLAEHLRNNGIEVEFADREYTVLMITPENDEADFERLLKVLSSFEYKKNDSDIQPLTAHERAMSIREAILSHSETILIEQAEGRVCADPTVSCPPAVPIVVSGERITKEDVAIFKYHGIDTVSVIKVYF